MPPGYPPPPPGYPPPQGYPPYPAPPAGSPGYPYATYQQGPLGPIGRTRSIGICILLAVVTLSIYTFVWVYKTQSEMKRYSGRGLGGGLGLLIYIIFSPATYFLVPIEVAALHEDIDHRPSPVSGVIGFWFLLPLIGSIVWFVKVQGALNRYWMSKGAPPP
ncbi:MAG TPA: DUF4234 domain-containing protein [Candidatus Dormibacteraeota bacterium]